ncbi:MAG: SDR family NAD(P)-dependent oxidoreductase [Frankiaceae bacterium]
MTAVVTGASSGIGAATARRLSELGFDVVLGARRLDRVRRIATECGGRALQLDVTDADSVAAFAAEVGDCRVLVNNAGGALGLRPIEDADVDEWRRMYETNVLGTVRMTKSLLPQLEAAGGHVVVVGSIAGVEVYPGGGGYTAAKHAEDSLARTLRLELLGRPVRVSQVMPGMVNTEFSLVRLGSQEAADRVYQGMTPLSAADVADVIGYVVTRPPHVCIDTVRVLPRAQASALQVHRQT